MPNDLVHLAKYEAAVDGETLRSFILKAAQREIERRQAIPIDERRRQRQARRKEAVS